MPYTQEELKEVSEKTTEDPTLLQATNIPGSPDTNDEGEVTHKFTPVTLPDGSSWVRKPESTLDWSSYAFEQVMDDGTRNDFVFTAKDDADAQRKVRERVAATQHAGGTYKLSRMEAPKEIDLGAAFGPGLATVDEGDERKGEMAKAERKAKRGRPSKADKAAEKRAEANAADANAEKADEDES